MTGPHAAVEALPGPVWQQIRAGRVPDPDLLESLAAQRRAVLGAVGARRLADRLTAAVWGAGPLDAVLEDPAVTDVVVNGDGGVWVDRGAGMERHPLDLGDQESRRAFAVRLAALGGRRLDESMPYCDATLPSGVRLHAILPPLVPDGPHVTMRVPSRTSLDLPQLVRSGACPASWAPLLARLVAARISFVVTGGTGAGKTTVLAALLAAAAPEERLVVVEDVRELAVRHPHVVRLEGRAPNVEGAGAVTMVALVRQALRMRPDRIVVGEVRGAEVRELLTALNTGHEGGCGTLHANAPRDVVARFEALGALAGLGPRAVHAQLVSAVHVVIHMRRAGPVRVVHSISVLSPGPGGRPRVRLALARDARSGPQAATVGLDDGPGLGGPAGLRGPAWPRLVELLGLDPDPDRRR